MLESELKADLFLTVNGFNPAISPYTIQETEPIIIAVDGNTPYESNDITVTAEKGTLSNISDANEQYYLGFNADSGIETISLTVNTDFTIDTQPDQQGTTIYKLYLFYNSDDNTRVAIGIGLEGLIAVEEFYKEQSQTLAPESIMDSNDELSLDEGSGEGGEESGLKCIVEISYDITTNRIWTAECTYYITSWVDIRALLVIEPGTTIQFAPNTRMAVNDGGTLISCGTPDNPIIYTSDSVTPNYGDYNCPLQIEETASASTKLTYNYIEYANTGIKVVNKRLDNPIENNYFYRSNFGIREYGIEHTDTINNLFEDIYNYGIDANMASATGEGSADSRILIANNTCDDCNIGIIVRGVANSGDAGLVTITNNIVSNSRLYGLALVNGYMYYDVANTGYYNNAANTLYVDSEYNPVYETANPYITGTGTLPGYYLRQDCNFINKSDEYIEQTRLIGKTTAFNGLPDSNKADLGFHYPNWGYSNAGDGNVLTMDLNADLTTDFYDFAILANSWRTTYNLNDMKTMANEWLKHSGPNIQIQITGDPNTGYVDVGITEYNLNTLQTFLLVDGQYTGEIMFYDDEQILRLDVSSLGPGLNKLKVISVNDESKITCSNLTQIYLNCPFRYCTAIESYVQNQPYYFATFYQGSDNINVKVYDEDNIPVWSQTYPAQNLNGYIPTSITSRDDLDAIVFESTTTGTSITTSLAMAFIPWLIPSNIRALMLLPDKELNEDNKDVEEIVEQTFQYRGVPCYKLKLGNASYKNLNWFALNRNIEYLYVMAHGGHRVAQAGYMHTVPRTKMRLSDGLVVSAKQSDFAPGSAPSWCEKLPGALENTMHSMTGIYFVHGLKFVQLDSCWSGHWCLTSENASALIPTPKDEYGFPLPPTGSQSDMSWALGMNFAFDSFYQGWWESYLLYTPYQSFKIDEWTELRDGATLYEALYEAIWNADVEVLQKFVIYSYGDMYSFRIE